ncbi:MAG: hypothetical protein IH820_01135 [Bacteroidetes bacterium]|nr:hypothetical protein [Bacteroidota bacterium]
MEGTIFVIVLTAIICGTGMIATIFTSIFKYAMARSQPQKTDASLTTSELHGLIRDAVDEATEPLNERLAALEQRLEAQPQLPPARSDLLAETEGYLTEVPNVPERQPVR